MNQRRIKGCAGSRRAAAQRLDPRTREDPAALLGVDRRLGARVDEFAHGARRSQGNLIAHGATFEEILAGSPDLEREDIR